MSFGKALEQAGETEKAEKALREAVKLAPSYAYPRWHLGNLLIRTERYDEAFQELQRRAMQTTSSTAVIQPRLAS